MSVKAGAAGGAQADVQDGGGSAAQGGPHPEGTVDVHPRARLGAAGQPGAVGQEVLGEVVGLGGVVQEGVRGVDAGVDMTIDKAGADQLALRLHGAVDLAVEAAANVEDAIVFVDDNAIAQQLVIAAIEADDPAALNQRAHRAYFTRQP